MRGEFGLHYYRARYYDPGLGRFISEDPIGFAAGVNFYSYVANAPINFVDPSGHSMEGAARGLGNLCMWAGGGGGSTNVNDAVTADLANTPAMEDIRRKMRAKNCAPGTYCGDFNYGEFARTGNVVGHTVGGFCATVIPQAAGGVVIFATNDWGRESGTRFPRLPGGPDNRKNCSIQQMFSNPNCGPQWPKSALENVSSGAFATGTSAYIWTETNPCTGGGSCAGCSNR